MNTLLNFIIPNLVSVIIVAQLAYICGSIEATNNLFKTYYGVTPLTSTEGEKASMYPLTGTKAESDLVYPLTKPELVNETANKKAETAESLHNGLTALESQQKKGGK